MARLRVQFKQIEPGWAETCLYVDEKEYERWFSYIFPHVFAELCEALSTLIDGSQPQTITWASEPDKHEMHFSKEGNTTKLEMWRFEDHKRGANVKKVLEFAISGTCDEICLPFWRALQALQGLYSEKEFEQRWGQAKFPTQELARLTYKLGKD